MNKFNPLSTTARAFAHRRAGKFTGPKKVMGINISNRFARPDDLANCGCDKCDKCGDYKRAEEYLANDQELPEDLANQCSAHMKADGETDLKTAIAKWKGKKAEPIANRTVVKATIMPNRAPSSPAKPSEPAWRMFSSAKPVSPELAARVLRMAGSASRLSNRADRMPSAVVLKFDRRFLNRFSTPADDWYHIAPKGEFNHPTGVLQIIDNQSIKAIIDNFNGRKKSGNFPGILVDYDHVSQKEDGTTEAAGWIQSLQNRSDGLWANIAWTDTGKQAVDGGRFRLVSPSWKRSQCESMGENKLRPLALDSVALTNQPNIMGMTPLTR